MTAPAADVEPNPFGSSVPHATTITPPQIVRARPPVGERGQVKSQTYVNRRYLGDANLEKLTSAVVAQMEKDPQVRAGILIRELAILGKPGKFNYTPKNTADPAEVELGKRMVAFLEYAWNHLQPDPNRILRHILSARRYGFSVNELVWSSTYGPTGEPEVRTLQHPDFAGYVTVDRIKHLPSSSFEANGFATDEFGHLRFVFQNLARTARHKTEDLPGIVLAPQEGETASYGRIVFNVGESPKERTRLLVYVANPKDDGDYYGVSDHKAAYDHWYSKQASLNGIDLLLDRMAGVIVGEAGNNNELTSLQSALGNAAAGAVLTVPKESNVRVLEGAEHQVAGFLENIRYRDVQILRAYLVPNETVGGSDDASGSYARANSHLNSFFMSLGQIATEVEEVIEEQWGKPLIDANFGPVETYPTFDFPDPADKDLELLARVFDMAVKTGYADPLIDALQMRAETGFGPAPEGFQFKKPEPAQPFGNPFGAPSPSPSGPGKAVGGARDIFAARAAPEPIEPSLFTTVDHAEANIHTVESAELGLRAKLGDALAKLRDDILTNPPKTIEDVERIRIDPAIWQEALDAVARDMLDRVQADFARKFMDLGKPAIADRVTARKGIRSAITRVLSAAAPDDLTNALRAYTQWSQALNRMIAEGEANELQRKLRIRLLQAIATSVEPSALMRAVSDEFMSYTTSQLETVAKTTVFDYFNSARNTAIDAAGDYVLGVRIVALLDNTTTPFCRDIHGRSIRKTDSNFEKVRNAPFWYNCRDSVVPILRDESSHRFDEDWDQWLREHENVEGGGFLYGRS